MNINLIAALSKNNCIGKNNELAFHIKEDMKRFKELTTNNVIIIGSKTFESLPNKALPNRVNIVVTRNKDYTIHPKEGDRVLIVTSIEEAIKLYESWFYYEDGVIPCKKLFIIGGGSIYKYCLDNDLIDTMYLTMFDEIIENGDTFFPNYNEEQWEVIEIEKLNEKVMFKTLKKKR